MIPALCREGHYRVEAGSFQQPSWKVGVPVAAPAYNDQLKWDFPGGSPIVAAFWYQRLGVIRTQELRVFERPRDGRR
jgi:hypothetical protein